MLAGAWAQPAWSRDEARLVLVAAANPAAELEDLQRQQEAVDSQKRTLSTEQQRLQNIETAASDRLRQLESTIQGTTAWIDDTAYQIAQAERQIQLLESDLTAAQQSYEQVRQATVGRLQFMQRQQQGQGWAVLLQSKDLNEFLDRRYQLKQVYQADQALLTKLTEKSAELVLQQQGVEAQKNAIALLRQQLLVQHQDYTQQAQQQTVLISRLQENRGALSAAINQLAADSEYLTGLIRERIAAAGGQIRGTGIMIYPVAGPITSNFGNRFHPVLGYSRFHAGTDFGASYGSIIRAADAGTVIFAGWYGGYGNAVIIDHGKGLTTLYAHASRLDVGEGQDVAKGQVIAAVGSTGLSTGPHLHFEVRSNGEPINPMQFL